MGSSDLEARELAAPLSLLTAHCSLLTAHCPCGAVLAVRVHTLRRELSDVDKDEHLDADEFALMYYLVNLVGTYLRVRATFAFNKQSLWPCEDIIAASGQNELCRGLLTIPVVRALIFSGFQVQSGHPLPHVLPDNFVPPSKRR